MLWRRLKPQRHFKLFRYRNINPQECRRAA
jgi:hypothetical protein